MAHNGRGKVEDLGKAKADFIGLGTMARRSGRVGLFSERLNSDLSLVIRVFWSTTRCSRFFKPGVDAKRYQRLERRKNGDPPPKISNDV